MGENIKINSYIYTIRLTGWGQVVVNEKSEKKAREIVRNYNPIKKMSDIDNWDIGVKSIERTDELISHIDTIGIENETDETDETYLSQCKKCGIIFDHKMIKNCPLCDLKTSVESLPTNIEKKEMETAITRIAIHKQSNIVFCFSCGETFDTRLNKRCPLCSDSPRNNRS